MDAENWLLERLKQHGIDVYVAGEFATLQARLGHVIVTNRYGPVVAGRHNGKPETYAQLFERMYGTPLPTVPRGTDIKLNKRVKT
jgi:hypothetical protein